jgi:hypothetical protein
MEISKKVLVFLLVGVFSLTILPISSNAYVLNSEKLPYPTDAYYWIDPTFNNYGLKSEVVRGATLGIAFQKFNLQKRYPWLVVQM